MPPCFFERSTLESGAANRGVDIRSVCVLVKLVIFEQNILSSAGPESALSDFVISAGTP